MGHSGFFPPLVYKRRLMPLSRVMLKRIWMQCFASALSKFLTVSVGSSYCGQSDSGHAHTVTKYSCSLIRTFTSFALDLVQLHLLPSMCLQSVCAVCGHDLDAENSLVPCFNYIVTHLPRGNYRACPDYVRANYSHSSRCRFCPQVDTKTYKSLLEPKDPPFDDSK